MVSVTLQHRKRSAQWTIDSHNEPKKRITFFAHNDGINFCDPTGRVGMAAFKGATQGDFYTPTTPAQKVGKWFGQVGAGLIPVVGQAADARDFAAAVHTVKTEGLSFGSAANVVLAGIGFIPGAGDAAKGILKPALGAKAGAKTGTQSLSNTGTANTGKSLWGFWGDYSKVTIDGREYAQIGDRLYTQHAIDRMTPSGLGKAAGGTEGRSISPNFVANVLTSPAALRTPTVGPKGEARISHQFGSLKVVTENDIVITIITQ